MVTPALGREMSNHLTSHTLSQLRACSVIGGTDQGELGLAHGLPAGYFGRWA